LGKRKEDLVEETIDDVAGNQKERVRIMLLTASSGSLSLSEWLGEEAPMIFLDFLSARPCALICHNAVPV
jgi:hypothetical protein